jgi:hypothetical protein
MTTYPSYFKKERSCFVILIPRPTMQQVLAAMSGLSAFAAMTTLLFWVVNWLFPTSNPWTGLQLIWMLIGTVLSVLLSLATAGCWLWWWATKKMLLGIPATTMLISVGASLVPLMMWSFHQPDPFVNVPLADAKTEARRYLDATGSRAALDNYFYQGIREIVQASPTSSADARRVQKVCDLYSKHADEMYGQLVEVFASHFTAAELRDDARQAVGVQLDPAYANALQEQLRKTLPVIHADCSAISQKWAVRFDTEARQQPS